MLGQWNYVHVNDEHLHLGLTNEQPWSLLCSEGVDATAAAVAAAGTSFPTSNQHLY